MNMKRTVLVVGQTYKNKNGTAYRCIDHKDGGDYVMQSVASGWTLTAHGIWIYDNGEIEWDYSTEGEFKDDVSVSICHMR